MEYIKHRQTALDWSGVRQSFVMRWRRHAGAAFTVFVLCGVNARMQNVTESSLKAAFVYNFALFTEWPPNAAAGDDHVHHLRAG